MRGGGREYWKNGQMTSAARRNNARLRLPAILGLVLGMAAAALWAEASTARPDDAKMELPDVAGFRPGMTLQEAYAKMKVYDAKAKIDVQSVTIPEISEKPLPYQLTLSEFGTEQAGEAIQIGVTLPPTRQVVWKVARQLQVVQPSEDMSRTTLTAALRKKYGPETYSSGGGGDNLVWILDEDGRPAKENRPPASPCAEAPVLVNTNGLGMAILNHPSPMFPQDSTGGWLRCKSLVFVRAMLERDPAKGGEYIRRLVVTVGDSGTATRAQDATVALIAKADGQRQRQELENLKEKPAPKL